MCRVRFLNTAFDNLTMAEALSVSNFLIQQNKAAYIVTPNVDHLVLLEQNAKLVSAYRDANLILTDGMPIVWFSRLFGSPIKEKISGSDFLPKLCELAACQNYKIFFLGAADGVALEAKRKLSMIYPTIKIVGCYSPPLDFEKKSEEIKKIDEMLKETAPDILVVALGCPKQEIFIYENRTRWNIPLSIGVGAGLDFIAGRMKRAPRWMSSYGLEWLYRMRLEPGRMFKRYVLRDWKFLKLLFKYRKRD